MQDLDEDRGPAQPALHPSITSAINPHLPDAYGYDVPSKSLVLLSVGSCYLGSGIASSKRPPLVAPFTLGPRVPFEALPALGSPDNIVTCPAVGSKSGIWRYLSMCILLSGDFKGFPHSDSCPLAGNPRDMAGHSCSK